MFGILRTAARYPSRLITKAAVPSRNYLIFWDPVSHKYPEYGLDLHAEEEEDDEEYENVASELTSAEYDEYIAKVLGEMDELKEYQYTGWKLHQIKPKQVRRIRQNMNEGRIARQKVHAVLDLINYRKHFSKRRS